MRKYLEVFKLHFKMQIVWRFDLAMTAVSTAARLVAAYILWSAIFGGGNFAGGDLAGGDLVGGFSFRALLSYYIVSAILATVDFSRQISGEVSELIRSGRFSGYMVIPANPFMFFSSMVASETAFHLGFSVISAAICALSFRSGFIFTDDAPGALLALIMIPLGLFFMAAYHFIIGVLTFKFLEINFFLHVQDMLISFATGALLPLSMLPGGALTVMKLLPFTHVIYTPAMLLTGRIDANEGLLGFVVLICWTAAAAVIAQITYTKMRIRYDGVGI